MFCDVWLNVLKIGERNVSEWDRVLHILYTAQCL